jgi:hypothetical protein
MTTYLHFSSANNGSIGKFPLECNSEVKYTSKDIMLACFRALCHMIESFVDSALDPCPLLENIETPDPRTSFSDTDMPPPICCEAQVSLQLYVICSSVFYIFKSQRMDLVESQFVHRLGNEVIVPLLTKMENVWPIATQYLQAVQLLLNDFPLWE